MIGIIGAGAFGSRLLARLRLFDVPAVITSRDLGKATRVLEGFGPGLSSQVRSFEALSEEAPVLVLALPYGAALTLARHFPAFAAGKVVLDPTNPWMESTPVAEHNGAVELVRAVPYVRLVKALNTISLRSLEGSAEVAIPVAYDDPEAGERVMGLLGEAAIHCVPIGPLAVAGELEGYSLVNKILRDDREGHR